MKKLFESRSFSYGDDMRTLAGVRSVTSLRHGDGQAFQPCRESRLTSIYPIRRLWVARGMDRQADGA